MVQVKNAAIVVDYRGSMSVGRGTLLAKHLRAIAEGLDEGRLIMHNVHVHLTFSDLTDGARSALFTAESVEDVNLEEE